MSVTAPFLGMQTTGGWEANQPLESYREEILFLDPNGTAPLLGMLSKMGAGKPLNSGAYHWYTQVMPEQGGTITDVCLDSDFTTYVSGAVAGSILYVRVTATPATGVAQVSEFRPDQLVVLRYSLDDTVDVLARVLSIVVNGTSSYVVVKLVEADDNSARGYNLANADKMYVVGSSHQEGGMPPTGVNYVPTRISSHTMISKDTWKISGSALETELRTAPNRAAIIAQKRQTCRMLHFNEMEGACFFNKYGEETAGDGSSIWKFMGIFEFVKTYASSNIDNFRYNAAYSTLSWTEGGEDWINTALNANFKYKARDMITPPDRIGFTGLDGLQALNNLALAAGQPRLEPKQKAWGIQVVEWYTSGGMVYVMVHPRFNQNVTLNRTLVVFHPSLVKYVYLRNRDTKRTDVTPVGFDGVMEQYQTEWGIELYHAPMFSILSGLGQDSLV